MAETVTLGSGSAHKISSSPPSPLAIPASTGLRLLPFCKKANFGFGHQQRRRRRRHGTMAKAITLSSDHGMPIIGLGGSWLEPQSIRDLILFAHTVAIATIRPVLIFCKRADFGFAHSHFALFDRKQMSAIANFTF